VDIRELLSQATGFDWDEGNLDKNLFKHGVEFWEAEEVFFNRPLVVREDPGHSAAEPRYYAFGRTDAGRRLFLAFTVRKTEIRVISTRDMTRRELAAFKHHEKETHP
jgi:uncharacterized DUF497 family protein